MIKNGSVVFKSAKKMLMKVKMMFDKKLRTFQSKMTNLKIKHVESNKVLGDYELDLAEHICLRLENHKKSWSFSC